MGYQINEYDWCVMNKSVNDKKCIILWHVNNLNMLHIYSDVFSSPLSEIDAEYGNITKMTITQGKINNNIGMTINYSLTGKVIFSMVNYIGSMLDDTLE